MCKIFLCNDSSFQKTISAFAFLRATITKASTLIYRTSTQQSINVPDEFGFLVSWYKRIWTRDTDKSKGRFIEALQRARTLGCGPSCGAKGFLLLENIEVAGVNQSGCRLAALFSFFWNTDVRVHVRKWSLLGLCSTYQYVGCRKGLSQPGTEFVSGLWRGFRSENQTTKNSGLVPGPLLYSYLLVSAIVLAGLDSMEQCLGTFYFTFKVLMKYFNFTIIYLTVTLLSPKSGLWDG